MADRPILEVIEQLLAGEVDGAVDLADYRRVLNLAERAAKVEAAHGGEPLEAVIERLEAVVDMAEERARAMDG